MNNGFFQQQAVGYTFRDFDPECPLCSLRMPAAVLASAGEYGRSADRAGEKVSVSGSCQIAGGVI